MYYSKRDKMIMMPLFAYNIYYVVILLSFLDIPQFRGHVITFLKIAIKVRRLRLQHVFNCTATIPLSSISFSHLHVFFDSRRSSFPSSMFTELGTSKNA